MRTLTMCLFLTLVACADPAMMNVQQMGDTGPNMGDAGPQMPDAFVMPVEQDAGTDAAVVVVQLDAGTDAATPCTGVECPDDAATPVPDSGTTADAGHDAAAPGSDAGTPADHTGLVQVVAGSSHACVLRTSGKVHCWGAPLPPGVPTASPAVTDSVQVTAHGDTTCSLSATGATTCWNAGALPSPSVTMSEISVGCGTTPAGTVSCWSGGATPPTGVVSMMDGGPSYWCAVGSDHSAISCWGSAPTAAPVPSVGDVRAISVNGNVCVIDGTEATCWGGWPGGGLGTNNGRAMTDPSNPNYVEAEAGPGFACGRRPDGTVWCWGSNVHGQLGRSTVMAGSGDDLHYDTMAGEVLLADGSHMNATDVAVGEAHACAILADGRVFCWGNNDQGQLGTWTGSSLMSTTPVQPDSFWTE